MHLKSTLLHQFKVHTVDLKKMKLAEKPKLRYENKIIFRTI